MLRRFFTWVGRWLALQIVDQDRLRTCRLQIVFMELRKGDQSGEHLKKAIADKGVGMSSVQFYLMMGDMKARRYAELFYVQMPFGQQKIPYFHLKAWPSDEFLRNAKAAHAAK